jgi:DNA-binding YbaB/EbfC family protein
MGRMNQKWKKRMLLLILIPFFTSALIRLYGWIIVFRSNGVLDKILMGLDITSKPLKLLYTYPAVVVGMIYALMPFMILAVYSSAEKLDYSLVEAARDLGASPWKAFWTVSFKLTLPGLLSGVVLTFVPSMGLFFIADLLGGNKIVLVGNVIQEQMTKAQEELDEREYSAQAGGGMVTVTVTGKRELKNLEIKPECVDPDDVEMLQDMILAAVNEALRVADETRNNEMSKLAPGMGGMF